MAAGNPSTYLDSSGGLRHHEDMARYREIADDLRSKIKAGKYPVGSRLPTISELQVVYDVPASLNTIRAAQQLLVDEGMIETRQGIGAFVLSETSALEFDVTAAITQARDSLTAVLGAMESQGKRRVTVDLEADEYAYFVLTDALGDWVVQVRGEIEDDPEGNNAHRIAWAACAERLLGQIERHA